MNAANTMICPKTLAKEARKVAISEARWCVNFAGFFLFFLFFLLWSFWLWLSPSSLPSSFFLKDLLNVNRYRDPSLAAVNAVKSVHTSNLLHFLEATCAVGSGHSTLPEPTVNHYVLITTLYLCIIIPLATTTVNFLFPPWLGSGHENWWV